MLTSSGGGRSMLTGGRGDKICQNLADVICERSLRTKIPWMEDGRTKEAGTAK